MTSVGRQSRADSAGTTRYCRPRSVHAVKPVARSSRKRTTNPALSAASTETSGVSVCTTRHVRTSANSPSSKPSWMTATAFGLAHWFGHPRGPSGVALTLVAGLFLAKAMLETRGLLWPWAIHAAQDVLIFAFLVLSS